MTPNGWEFHPPSRPRRVEGGIKARSTRGAIGESWWSRRFLRVLESFALGSRLTRGRSYARAGQVLTLTVAAGAVTAAVQGSRATPYRVRIALAPLPERAWNTVERALAAQALFSAKLLAGEMPSAIEDVFAAAKAPLFPRRVGDLEMSCSCPDYALPCKHLAATFYLLAEAFDADPFQILAWRGRDRATLMARLSELRAGAARPDAEGELGRPGPGGAPERPGRDGGAKRPARARRARGDGLGRAGGQAAGTAPALAVDDANESTIGTQLALADLPDPDLSAQLDQFWTAPVPLPGTRPPVLAADADLLLRQLPTPPASLGGAELADVLRAHYRAFASDAERVR